eukprot:Lankesteria_metandrocarpae@DN9165_c0_g1_i1.p1
MVTAAIISALRKLHSGGSATKPVWATQTAEKIQTALTGLLRPTQESQYGGFDLLNDPVVLSRYLFTLGELAVPVVADFGKRVSIPAHTASAAGTGSSGEVTGKRLLGKVSDVVMTVVQAIATDTIGAAMVATKKRSLLGHAPAPGTNTTTNDNSGAAGGISVKVSPKVRATAFATLGKIYLCDEVQVKRGLDAFVGHLSANEHPVVKNNVLVAMSDLCVQHALMFDKYLPYMSACLADSTAFIRKRTLALLAGLVSSDYVKLKGRLTFRLMYNLSDPNVSIREFSEAVFTRIIFRRQVNFVQLHFVEALCFFNGWTGHSAVTWTGTNKSSSTDNKLFSLLSAPNRRQMTYQFLLANMSDRDKHEVSRRIIAEFLAPFVDSSNEYSDRPAVTLPTSPDLPDGCALRDALRILGCKQMKILFGTAFDKTPGTNSATAATGSGGAEGGADDDVPEAAKDKEAKRLYESNLLKRNLAFQILPTLLSLKRLMEEKHSPFLRDLHRCLGCLLLDYRNELPEVLFNDPILAKQLELDFKRGVFDESTADLAVGDTTATRAGGGKGPTGKHRGGRQSLLLEPTTAQQNFLKLATAAASGRRPMGILTAAGGSASRYSLQQKTPGGYITSVMRAGQYGLSIPRQIEHSNQAAPVRASDHYPVAGSRRHSIHNPEDADEAVERIVKSPAGSRSAASIPPVVHDSLSVVVDHNAAADAHPGNRLPTILSVATPRSLAQSQIPTPAMHTRRTRYGGGPDNVHNVPAVCPPVTQQNQRGFVHEVAQLLSRDLDGGFAVATPRRNENSNATEAEYNDEVEDTSAVYAPAVCNTAGRRHSVASVFRPAFLSDTEDDNNIVGDYEDNGKEDDHDNDEHAGGRRTGKNGGMLHHIGGGGDNTMGEKRRRRQQQPPNDNYSEDAAFNGVVSIGNDDSDNSTDGGLFNSSGRGVCDDTADSGGGDAVVPSKKKQPKAVHRRRPRDEMMDVDTDNDINTVDSVAAATDAITTSTDAGSTGSSIAATTEGASTEDSKPTVPKRRGGPKARQTRK